MTEPQEIRPQSRDRDEAMRRTRRRRNRRLLISLLGCLLLIVAAVSWLAYKASKISADLSAATGLVQHLKHEISTSDIAGAAATVDQIAQNTESAKNAAQDPVWTLASGLPWIGPNLSAVAEVARSADDVADLGIAPLVRIYDSLDWKELIPKSSGSNLSPLKDAAPTVSSAAYAVAASADRLNSIDSSNLFPQVSDPLERARDELQQATSALNTAANVAKIAPDMLGADGGKRYLLMIQNNAESRASGGIPGALAVLSIDQGKLTLGKQSSATELGAMRPVLPVETEQQEIFSSRIGKYMQDVNLTPDFPTAAATAKAMWKQKTGEDVDGVISIDPVAFSYLLDATGPIKIRNAQLAALAGGKLPLDLTRQNVVPTLLSEVYAKIDDPQLQDAYFAGVAQELFSALLSGSADAKALIGSLTQGVDEGRVSLWSADSAQQAVIANYRLGGAVNGPNVAPAEFGAYFNDGTGAKMDYYVKRTVQLVRECPKDGYQETTVRVISTNTAPADAARALPAYVTGGGHYGVPAGTIQTNVVAYGPAQSNIESASLDGEKTPFAPHFQASRPVGIVAQQLAPGETKTLEFTFGKIVQHAEPNLVVTPSVQPVKDVILPTENASCSEGQ
ncbi:DUF4012 domain-containing protein [Arthrobacter sp. NQ7]|uniref:DUF4012 domain-containing protein n=1 Tax=Arthrobacter sp. NQ7 TaxID=3032303 RepID=UPI00240FAC30|nr:DUF4012 domain-containing protein [Arthrobacter sp. NQ7]MDJ0455836.1 DUF4012 domain-containing protein [Arthrobacter sp. NQ7]